MLLVEVTNLKKYRRTGKTKVKIERRHTVSSNLYYKDFPLEISLLKEYLRYKLFGKPEFPITNFLNIVYVETYFNSCESIFTVKLRCSKW